MDQLFPQLVPPLTLAVLGSHADAADGDCRWPAESWQMLRQAGVLGWSLPAEFGGQDLSPTNLLHGYAQLASACLTTCFILSQREAACRRILDSGNDALCRELLPPLARGRFTTVGLSQLTTSRQHGQPALSATLAGSSLTLNGSMPWVTGASQADHIITGAVLEDGRQILATLPRNLPGVTIAPPLPLMALQGSLTAEVHLANVKLDRRWLLAGPAEKVMASGRGGTGGLETSCLALGLTRSAIDYLYREADHRPELRTIADRLEQGRSNLFKEMLDLQTSGVTPAAAASLRAQANTIVLRATQAGLTASKGAGFLRSHPAQRWARQAMFFLVWSCPRPATEATLAYLTPEEGNSCS